MDGARPLLKVSVVRGWQAPFAVRNESVTTSSANAGGQKTSREHPARRIRPKIRVNCIQGDYSMSRRSFIERLQGTPATHVFCRTPLARSLRCERLEDRRLLAQLTVTTDQDIVDLNDGVTSLREAIFAANIVPGADEIVFDFGHDGPATILLTQGELQITDALTITGPGAELLKIDVSGSDPTPDENNRDGSRVFNIDNGRASNLDASISGMTLTGGDVLGDGGAIYSAESLNLIDCVIVANHSGAGGGLYSYTLGGQVTVRQTEFIDNVAGFGGGVKLYAYANSEIVFEDLQFVGNRAELGGGGAEFGAGSSRIRVSRSTFSHNSVEGNGGGLAIFAGADSAIRLQDSLVTQNQANFGGGVFMYATDLRSFPVGEAIMSQCTVSSNTARISGGGVYVLSNTSVEFGEGGSIAIRHSTVTGNVVSATSTLLDAGGVSIREYGSKQVLMDHSIIAANTRGAAPSDINSADPITISYSLIGSNAGTNLGNAPIGHPDANGNIIGSSELGMSIDPLLGPLADNGGPTLTHALLPGSPAINAGDPSPDDLPEFDQRGEQFNRVFGGRIDIGAYERQSFVVDTLVDEIDKNYGPGDLSLREAIDLANLSEGADIIEFSPDLAGGTIMLRIGSLQIRDNVQIVGLGAELLTIDNSLTQGPIFNVDNLTNNTVIEVGLSGLTLTGSKQSAVRSVEALTVDSMTFRGNQGPRGGGIVVEQGSNQVLNAKLTVLNSQFIDNRATLTDFTTGGGIMFRGRFGEFAVENSTFVENFSGGNGGGIAVSGFSNLVNVTDSTFTGNEAVRGGAIYITDDNAQLATLQGLEIKNNTAQISGGGLYLSGKAVTVLESDISGNRTLTVPSSYGGGGGIFKTSGDPFIIERTHIADNHSAMNGGGIMLTGSPLVITDSNIVDNSAGRAGGGLSSGGTRVEMRRSTVAGNEAMTSGGGLSLSNGRGSSVLILADSTISDNTAHEVGGGINTSGFGLQISNSTISTNSADVSGGGIYASNIPTSLIAHSTIAFNIGDANGDDIGGGGGIAASGLNTINLYHSIAAGNLDANDGPSDVSDNVKSENSLIGVGAEFLGPLADNGGPTKTHALLPGSPAIDTGEPTLVGGVEGVPEFDQRGEPFTRVFGSAIDIGAFEAQSLVVDTFADENDGDYSAGDFSLREAIELANRIAGANKIEFSPELVGGTILIVTGEYAITDAIEIVGLGSELLTIDAQQQSRIFNVTAKLGDFALSGMTLTKGSTSELGTSFGGGAIRSDSSGLLTLDDVHFVGNRTLGHDARGGAVYATGTLHVQGGQFIENSTAGNNATGGAVHAIGDVTIEASGFARNKSSGFNANGGAVFTLRNLTVDEASFVSNTTLGSNSPGGAISALSLLMANSTVAENSTNGSSSAGGGINVGASRGGSAMSSSITDSIIIDNYTIGTSSRGGGISAGDTITIERSTISGNFTIGGTSRGGGLYASIGILKESEIVGNRTYGVGSFGGGAAGSSPKGWQIVGSSFLLNETFGGGAGGGGVFVDGELTVIGSTFNGNSAFGPQAGGGAINATRIGSTLLVESSTFTNNSASRGGAIATQLNTTIIDSVLTGNRAHGVGGEPAGGGAVYQANSPTGLTILRSRIADNQALGLNNIGGGGIRALGPTTITQSEISNNRVIGQGGRGGGLFIQGPATITDSTISGNRIIGTGGQGGGLSALNSVTVVNSTISGNEITGSQGVGGGLFSLGTLNMRHSTVTQNRISDATGKGSGLWNGHTQSVISHSIIAGNVAGGVDADLSNSSIGQVQIDYSLVGANAGSGLAEAPIGSPDANGNLIGGPVHGVIDAMLGPLADNDGPTETHVLQPGSPAINAGIPSAVPGANGVPEFDQRGVPFARIADGRIDIGAFESQSAAGALHGDFDGDGDADGRDFLLWQRGFGRVKAATRGDGDATGDGDVDGNDLAVWQETYGEEQDIADWGLRIVESEELSALRTASSLSRSLAVSRRESASGDDPAFEERYVEQVDRVFEQWTPPRRSSVDFGDIVTHRHVKRRDLAATTNSNL